jgi:DNA-binding GntR family transcriptional regulator
LSRDLLSRKVADVLSRQILSGTIPSGSRLVGDEVADMLGVSRVPVREALVMLERERLVTSTPGRGAFVRELTEEWVTDLFEVRALLEVRAAERAALRIAADPGLAEELRTLSRRFSQAAAEGLAAEYIERDLGVHRGIWKLSGNQHLLDVLTDISAPAAVLLTIESERTSNWDISAPRRHEVLVEAVASGDPKVAGEVIREHMARAEQAALQALRMTRQEPGRSSALAGRAS